MCRSASDAKADPSDNCLSESFRNHEKGKLKIVVFSISPDINTMIFFLFLIYGCR